MSLDHPEVRREGEGEDVELRVVEPNGITVWDADTTLDVVGTDAATAPSRLEAVAKVTGAACYTSDVALPGQLHAAVLRSPHAHARVVSVDVGPALELEGVVAALSSNDDLDIDWYAEEVPIFPSTVRFAGDEVAVVAATSPERAVDAVRAIRVEYEPLPPVATMARALDPDGPGVHGGTDNVVGEPDEYERGDVDAAFERADVFVEMEFSTQAALHNCLEPHATVAHWSGDDLVIYESTQGVHAVRDQLADTLGLPRHRVRVHCEHMGGGFGSKQTLWKQTVLAALLARRTGRPVRLVLDREGECLATGNRNPTSQTVRLAARSDGTLIGIEAEATAAVGAYQTSGEGSAITSIFQHLYRCENVRTSQRFVYTTTGPAVAFRAPGYVEGCFALESAMDELASKLEMDPIELRRRNYTEVDQVNDRPWSSPQTLEACYSRIESAFGGRFRSAGDDGSERGAVAAEHAGSAAGIKRGADRGPRTLRGYGFAAHEWAAGSGAPPTVVWCTLNEDATVELVTGTQDIGTGTRTVLAQTTAEILGLATEEIAVRLGDTGVGLRAPVSQGSFTVPTLAPAVRAAAEDLRGQVLLAAAELFEQSAADLALAGGEIRAGDEVVGCLKEVTQALSPHLLRGHGARRANPEDVTIRPFGAMAAVVDVDLDTGEVTVVRIVDAPDCGRILNRKLAASQVLGGVTQGVGFTLMEDRVVDEESGQVLNGNLEEYLVPTVLDIPTIEHAEVDLPDVAANPLGVKGLGELPLIPVAPAITNAIHDAIGVRITELPVSRGDILEALNKRCPARSTANRLEEEE